MIARFPHLKAVVAGEGDDTDRLTALTHELGLDAAVEFTGYITEAQKVDLLRRAWFTVTTSLKEGWGLTVVEANACGTPSIAADVPGLRDAVREGETGLLYTHGDSAALSACMFRLLEDGALRSRLCGGLSAGPRRLTGTTPRKRRSDSSAAPRCRLTRGPGSSLHESQDEPDLSRVVEVVGGDPADELLA